MKKLLIAALLSCLPIAAQSPSGLLNTNRYIDWTNAGAGTIPARATVCTTLTSSATPAAVASALSACPSGQTVALAAGTYNWSSSLISTASNVTLRGAGPNLTKLVFSGTSTNCLGIGPVAMCLYNGDSGAIGFAANVLTVTSGMTQGSTSVVLGSAPGSNICGSGSSACSGSISNLHVGSLISFNQLDDASDTGNALFNGSTTYSQQGDGGNVFPGRSQIQLVTVTGIAGSTVTFTPALYAPNWSSGKTPLATFSSSLPLTGFGLENLTVDTQAVTGSTSDAAMIQFIWATNSWIKNVAMVNATTTSTAMHKHVWVAASSHITVRDSYEYGSSPSSEAYGVDLWQSDDSLAENNICQKIATCEIMEGGVGNVFGYHYAVDNFYDNGDPAWQQCDQFHHNAGDYYNLWEGNIGICHTEDSIHGTAFANTVFRNALSGFDPSTSTAAKTQNLLTINDMGYARYVNYVANVLGYGGHASTYSYAMTSTTDCGIGNSGMVFLLGDTGQIGSEYSSTCYGGTLSPPGPVPNDVVANAGPSDSSMLCGNWDAVTAGIHTCQTASTASTYPGLASPSTSYASYPSFYLASQPSWWVFPSGSTAPFPAIGPDVTGGNIASTSGHAWLNPANNCYKNVMGGLTDGSSTALPFDAASCYVGASTVATPTFSPVAGTYSSTQTVTLSTVTGGASIVYTIDGSTPTVTALSCTITHGTLYSGALTVSTSQTIKAIGCLASENASSVGSAAYVISIPSCSLSFSPVAGTYTGTQNVTITKTSCPAGTTVYYRTDGLPATVVDTAYSTPIPIASSQTLAAIAVLNPTIRDQPQTISTQKKCNAVGSPITFPSGYSCNNGSGGVAGAVSDFNFVAGASNQWTVTSTDTSAFDSSILHIDTPTATPDVAITHLSYRNVFQDSSNCSQTSANLYKCIDVSEFDAESAKDPTTNALWQMSARCSTNAAGSSGNNGFLEGDASSGNEKWDIPCVIGAQTDVTINTRWTLGDTGCGGSGCMVLDAVYLKTGAGALTEYDFPASCDVSDTNCPNYPMTAQPSYSNFTAGSQQQMYTRNVTVAGTSPLTTTRNSLFIRVGVDEGNEATGSAAYVITPTPTFTLSFTATNGSVSGANCANGTYTTGTVIGPCTATPNTGYSFTGWSGTGSASGCSGTGTCGFTLTANSTATAAFTINSYTLSTATTGAGTGTISGCAGAHNFATSYSCTVTATGGSTLASVSGCSGSGTTTYTGNMPASNCTVTATFNAPVGPTSVKITGTVKFSGTVGVQ